MDVIGYAALFVAFALPVIAYMVLSATWYSALFGELFLSLAFPNSPPTNTDSPLPYLAALCGNIIANGGVYCLVESLGTESVFEGACYGALIAVISLGVGLPHPFFEDRSIKLFLLHKSLHLIGLTLMGAYHTVLHLEMRRAFKVKRAQGMRRAIRVRKLSALPAGTNSEESYYSERTLHSRQRSINSPQRSNVGPPLPTPLEE